MSDSGHSRILSETGPSGLTGREREMDLLTAHGGGGPGRALLFLSAPAAGSSEILKAHYDRLFHSDSGIVPVYFEFRISDGSARAASERFLLEFISQVVAFRRREPALISAHPDARDLRDLAPAPDKAWIADLLRSCPTPDDQGTDLSVVSRAFAAPVRASVQGVRCFVMVDGLENTLAYGGGSAPAELVGRILSGGGHPFVLASKRRFGEELLKTGRLDLRDPVKCEIEPLSFENAGLLVEAISASTGISVTEQSRDLIATSLGSRPAFIREIFAAAAETGADLRSFRDVLKARTDSVFGGRIGGRYDAILDSISGTSGRGDLIELLHSMMFGNLRLTPASVWIENIAGSGQSARDAMELLDAHEIIRVSAGGVRAGNDDILRDYVRSRFRLDVRREPYSRVYADSLSGSLKRAAGVMSALYRSLHSTGVEEILGLFNCQEIPLSLLDYGMFSDEHKGKEPVEMLGGMREELEKVKLPQIYHTDSASAFYEPLSELIDADRAAIALGFEHAEYEEDNEVAWIAAEIDSKLEANEELTSFWCDRLEMVAVANDLERYRIWLISPEGFSLAALEVLHQRHAIGSSRVQARLLKDLLVSGTLGSEPAEGESFEIVIPMGEDTELIAAHAVEDVARKTGFDTSAVNQIKTALVEACINATEHSFSPDRRIHVEITSGEGSLIITVVNRGVRFKGQEEAGSEASEIRRGWGLKLMRSLMDDVVFERVEDGTRIRMVKKKTDNGSEPGI